MVSNKRNPASTSCTSAAGKLRNEKRPRKRVVPTKKIRRLHLPRRQKRPRNRVIFLRVCVAFRIVDFFSLVLYISRTHILFPNLRIRTCYTAPRNVVLMYRHFIEVEVTVCFTIFVAFACRLDFAPKSSPVSHFFVKTNDKSIFVIYPSSLS